MSTAQIVVTLLGIGAVAWINWYFFLAEAPEVAAAAGVDGPQRARIEVKGGYSPAVVRVRAGRPVRLEFYRDETSGCTEEVVLPDFGIRTFLPPYRTTPVEFTPVRAGSYEFTCGMGMVRGRVIAEAPAADGGERP
ncbi:MAG TPA: cupredoxin domain-containing protein [Gemmatimonadales bacterium]|nr:cupredoxin domain-containing protein [Gemmatimonadales bacterium]